jgi:phosphoribosylaminoimidazolecarboxamide formyltransferase/IMP cyclohydrolase
MRPVRRALLSTYDKGGLLAFAQALAERGVALISTGGTARVLREAGLEVASVSDITRFPEMMDGRVKTLHPAVHGGILARRDLETHMASLAEHDMETIDLVVVNLYPFEETVAQPGVTRAEAIEQIDIGGPSMVRSAAKNHSAVGVVTDPADYEAVLSSMDGNEGALDGALCRRLAAKAFLLTARYDSAIAAYLGDAVDEDEGIEDAMPRVWGTPLRRKQVLRYGENPHQRAARYGAPGGDQGLTRAVQLQGKELSYNNWLDMDGAYAVARDLGPQGVVVVKHTNPCGAARSEVGLLDAYEKARAVDPLSAFGGIVATMGTIDEALAATLAETFLEVILASDVTAEAREVFARKKRLRVLTLDEAGWSPSALTHVSRPISGGMLVQEEDRIEEIVRHSDVVTKRAPTEAEWDAMTFGWTLCRHVKSNAIVFSHADRAAAIGAGQMSRVDSSKLAVMKATVNLEGSAVASDAFFPFPDGVEAAAAAGATAVVQPGGSIKDAEVIAAADRLGMTMVFTGRRHFRH